MLPAGMDIQVCWARRGNDCPTLEYFADLVEGDPGCGPKIVEAFRKLERSDFIKPRLVEPFPVNKRVNDLYEVRIYGSSAHRYIRFAMMYAPEERHTIILMNGISKKTDRAEPKFVKQAVSIRNKIITKEMDYERIPTEKLTNVF